MADPAGACLWSGLNAFCPVQERGITHPSHLAWRSERKIAVVLVEWLIGNNTYRPDSHAHVFTIARGTAADVLNLIGPDVEAGSRGTLLLLEAADLQSTVHQHSLPLL